MKIDTLPITSDMAKKKIPEMLQITNKTDEHDSKKNLSYTYFPSIFLSFSHQPNRGWKDRIPRRACKAQ